MLPGLVVAALAGIPFLAGGAGGVAVAAVAIAGVSQVPVIGRDSAVAIVISALFGLGVLLALSPSSPPGIESLLFGNLLGLSGRDLVASGVLAAGVLVALLALHERLLVVGFDRPSARALGVRPLLADTALLVVLAGAVLVSVQAVGTLLTPALLVGPAAAARFMAHRMSEMMVVATVIGLIAGIGGVYLSFYAGTAAGASVAGVVVLLYATVRLWTGGARARTVPVAAT
jgi:ABC-type Mn2+/Zn2+ transport system permease subunit